ncbi:MAG: 6-carboxytetrahydropterin synthase [Chloroflexi bacterium]|nr:6-carboxytetrahydropterin synthase [Chloroflexota bacterium]
MKTSKSSLTKTFEFSASHRYYRDDWSEKRNRQVFGACANANGHGHNYLLEVTVTGPVDPVTGMVINLTDLKDAVEDVLREFDHYHLNLDTPYFKDRIPTSENFAATLWSLIVPKLPASARLQCIRLREDEDLFVEFYGERMAGVKQSQQRTKGGGRI